MFNKVCGKWLEKLQFNKQIKENFGITKSEAKILKNIPDKEFLNRIYEKIKLDIAVKSLMSNTPAGIQRRNNWIEAINYMQSFLKDKEAKEKSMDFLTMKKK